MKAGVAVWTDTSAKLLDQIRKMYDDVREEIGLDMAMQLEVTREMWRECFLKNEQVIEYVRYYNSLNNVLLPENLTLTDELAKNALAKMEGLPTIVIIEEKQNDIENGVVHGWADGVAVLRPLGYAGLIRRTTIKDVDLFKKYGNNVNSYSFTPALNGLATIRNSVVVNGNFKEWHTDLVLAAVPSLDEFLYHYIIDTKTAN